MAKVSWAQHFSWLWLVVYSSSTSSSNRRASYSIRLRISLAYNQLSDL
jgi:hypothetical protein